MPSLTANDQVDSSSSAKTIIHSIVNSISHFHDSKIIPTELYIHSPDMDTMWTSPDGSTSMCVPIYDTPTIRVYQLQSLYFIAIMIVSTRLTWLN